MFLGGTALRSLVVWQSGYKIAFLFAKLAKKTVTRTFELIMNLFERLNQHLFLQINGWDVLGWAFLSYFVPHSIWLAKEQNQTSVLWLWILYEFFTLLNHLPFPFSTKLYWAVRLLDEYGNPTWLWGFEVSSPVIVCFLTTSRLPWIFLLNSFVHLIFILRSYVWGKFAADYFGPKRGVIPNFALLFDNITHLTCLAIYLQKIFNHNSLASFTMFGVLAGLSMFISLWVHKDDVSLANFAHNYLFWLNRSPQNVNLQAHKQEKAEKSGMPQAKRLRQSNQQSDE
jgi:hypothetical protein